MADRDDGSRRDSGGGLLDGLNKLLENLSDLAETGRELRRTGQFEDKDGNVRGVYGLNVRVGLGGDKVDVEPFGNVHRDQKSGRLTVEEVREPMVDVFDEADHVLVVAEMPGIAEKDVELELQDDVLTIRATSDQKRYEKEVLLPHRFELEAAQHTCRNGVLEIRLQK
jgi:HSP20 family protein